jgi:hypothetical protein
MSHRLVRPSLSLAVVLGLAAACAQSGSAVVAGANPNPPPPPVRSEVIPKPPVSEDPLIWQPGHWDWEGTGYAWRAGEWVKRAGHGTEWQDGYWVNQSGNWTWVAGHWM